METANFDIIQGDSFVLVVKYTDSNKQPIDLHGYTAEFQVKDQPGGKVVCATATTSSGIVIDEVNGKLTVTLTPAQTKKFTVPRAAYQLQINSGTIKTTIATGWFQVEKGLI
jgi:hypothetical protein